jgi:hypothetical protein
MDRPCFNNSKRFSKRANRTITPSLWPTLDSRNDLHRDQLPAILFRVAEDDVVLAWLLLLSAYSPDNSASFFQRLVVPGMTGKARLDLADAMIR